MQVPEPNVAPKVRILLFAPSVSERETLPPLFCKKAFAFVSAPSYCKMSPMQQSGNLCTDVLTSEGAGRISGQQGWPVLPCILVSGFSGSGSDFACQFWALLFVD